jgi:hypothetical protein
MTGPELLAKLRARGYVIEAGPGGKLLFDGPPPRDEARAVNTLRARKADLLEALSVERDPAVVQTLEIFPGARLRAVLRAGEQREPEPGLGPAREGEPTGWQTFGEFRDYLSRIGARVYADEGGLTIVATANLLSLHVAAACRIWRSEMTRLAQLAPVRRARGELDLPI